MIIGLMCVCVCVIYIYIYKHIKSN
jgi:hypothetical protein